ncbi:hypothetical protein F1536_12345 [Achromobacter xylosoxidans]|jgi:hypothetical protein|uniref:hypothetical protein n=1 Tax=Alcaligenes xylosoxydans xylosoxydans TaxID=85698 RepID=UPI000DD1571F|nr:hypothetical protein [Achromobacter xylosoxidans]AXA79065.1 hypothetical protein CE206_22780 [Achromobacter xylosoxidans]KAA5926339.1 hypothetical protein F1536_12345 [Achromobacter xylosoxidans]QEQ24732.1 hypothetical protein F0U64_21350 [Achromobacter xylosoxidans]
MTTLEEARKGPLTLAHDAKRQGYWVVGQGFDFFLYFTGEHFECDSVRREGEDFALHVSFKLPKSGEPSHDVLMSQIVKELSQFWDLNGLEIDPTVYK